MEQITQHGDEHEIAATAELVPDAATVDRFSSVAPKASERRNETQPPAYIRFASGTGGRNPPRAG